MTPACVWDDLIGQPDAIGFLKSAIASGISHAYLFTGPPGAGKKTAARALACALICDDEGCGSCSACYRIKRGFHPDVRIVAPEGAASYMVPQIREIIREVELTPAEAQLKIFIIEAADMLNDASANAFLKTLEEPPDDVVIVLLAPTFDAVIPTISSRCQTVRFRRVPPDDAARVLMERTGAQHDEALAALAATGGVMVRARDFLESSSRREARRLTLRTLKDLPVMDGHDVLRASRDILAAAKAPLEEIKAMQAEEIREREEFMGSAAGKKLQDRHKRQLTAKEREAIAEILNIAESWLRDCLVLSQDVGSLVANDDHRDAMDEVAVAMTPEAAVRALDAVNEARRRISCNVNPQLAVEAMLYDLQEVLKCPR